MILPGQQNILAISTAGTTIVAVRCGTRTVVKVNAARRDQAEYLVPMVEEALHEADASFEDIARIGIVTGPGSFTGLRVGLAAARGFGLALGLPVIGISAFDMWRKAAGAVKGKFAVALDTLRDDFFAEGDGIPAGVYELSVLAKHDDTTFAGDALGLLDVSQKLTVNDRALAEALLALTAAADADEAPANPYYLRAPDVSQPAL